ncbi:hypothetical protein [Streptomyces sp. NPDC058373]
MSILAAVLDLAYTVWLVAQAVLAMAVVAATAAITYTAITVAARWGGAR